MMGARWGPGVGGEGGSGGGAREEARVGESNLSGKRGGEASGSRAEGTQLEGV
jgi:hypothetical protein